MFSQVFNWPRVKLMSKNKNKNPSGFNFSNHLSLFFNFNYDEKKKLGLFFFHSTRTRNGEATPSKDHFKKKKNFKKFKHIFSLDFEKKKYFKNLFVFWIFDLNGY